jgi:hypothetical protein
VFPGGFELRHRLVDIDRKRLKRNTSIAEQLSAPRR